MNDKPTQPTHGGPRPGAGRKPGIKTGPKPGTLPRKNLVLSLTEEGRKWLYIKSALAGKTSPSSWINDRGAEWAAKNPAND